MQERLRQTHDSQTILRMAYKIYKISENAFALLFGKYFFSAPLPYAIGNYCEDIKFSLIAASIKRQKLVLLLPPTGIWQTLLSYKHCNQSLYQAAVLYSQASIGKNEYWVLNTIYRINFIFLRIIYLLIGKRRFSEAARNKSLEISGISYYISFARYGIANIWNTLVNLEIDPASIKRTNEEVLRFRSILKKTSIHASNITQLNSKFCLSNEKEIIVMHFRSGQYHGDGNRRNRNANIENYKIAIEHLATKDACQIVIIGDENNLSFDKELDILNLPRLIPNLLQRRTFEIHALCSASWYIGTQSGPWDLAMLLGLSSIIFNSIDLSTAESTCWSNTVLVSKQINKAKSIDSWIKSYDCDLNGEDGGHTSFQNINSKDLFMQICDALIQGNQEDQNHESVTPEKYYSKYNFAIRAKHMLTHIGNLHHLDSREIDDIASKLIYKWEVTANRLDLESEADYFSDEIIRLIAKRKLSKADRSLCYLDKEGLDK